MMLIQNREHVAPAPKDLIETISRGDPSNFNSDSLLTRTFEFRLTQTNKELNNLKEQYERDMKDQAISLQEMHTELTI